MAVTYSGIDAIDKMNEGLDLAVIGGGLTTIQDIFVLKDSSIKTLADLKGKRLGVWSTGAGAYKVIRASILDAEGFDIAKDTKQQQVAAPALFKLSGKRHVRRHDQHQFLQHQGDLATGQIPLDLFAK